MGERFGYSSKWQLSLWMETDQDLADSIVLAERSPFH
jgi:hypothetical protein